MCPVQRCFVQIVHMRYNKLLNYIIYTAFFSKISASVAESELQKDEGKRGKGMGNKHKKKSSVQTI